MMSFRALAPLVIGLLVITKIAAEGDILPIPTTTDVPPETTTVPTTTSTAAPTTTPTTTSTSTTAAPTTTSTAAPTTPAPAPQVGSWNVTDTATNVTCIMLTMSAQFTVQYTTNNNKTATAMVTVPTKGASASGSCGNTTQNIVIAWKVSGLAADQMDQVSIEFAINSTTKTYYISKFAAKIYPSNFPDASGKEALTLDVTSNKLPSAPLAMSYRCLPVESFIMTGNSSLAITELQLQAFHSATDAKFGAASDCQAGDTADIVPIVVGCALAGLVVIVLIAYLIGRRRSRQSGYLSM